jgi:hypothetical protein
MGGRVSIYAYSEFFYNFRSSEREREREKGGSVTAQLRCIEFRITFNVREKKGGKIK